ncbi:clavesin-1-like [Toxorhynchites rutilus septentrionalis]|uniref:clavesin-1-like n=1 Tax=Toxorhynchites rutilus septentrionalis TaxID=329112 RepID=UPI002479AA2C|nr:clavesin-1-like [Toxorhynchites rutilus septentrionalis]
MASSELFSVEKKPSEYKSYVCVLSDRDRQQAKLTLGEDEAVREKALQHMRDWIARHQHIKKCRTDPLFLLRFLRARSFNLPDTCEMLERYLSMRQVFRVWLENLDPEDKYMKQLVATEGALPLGLDAQGRMVALVKVRNFDATKYSCYHLGRFTHMALESFYDDEQVQIGGGVTIIDCQDASMAHFTIFKLSDIKNFMECLKYALPVRVQEVHVIGLPRIGAAIGDLILNFASAEMKQRIFFHTEMADAIKMFDLSLLPIEYGGTQDARDITERLRKRLINSRSSLVQLDELEIDESQYAEFWNQRKGDDVEFGMEID